MMSSTRTAAVSTSRASAPRLASARPSRHATVQLRARMSEGQQAEATPPVPSTKKAVAAQPSAPKVTEKAPWVQPTLNPDTPSPIFGGSTGGLLRKAQVEEFYVITWEAKKEAIFEMPTGGAAQMRSGPNLLKLARKEQCLALETQLRSKFKIEPCFYRVFPDGKVEYLHPKDGVYPEKVNAGRAQVNTNMRRIGQNPNPIQVKFTGKKECE